MHPRLGDPDLAATQEDIVQAVVHLQEMLQIRNSSPLFRLRTAEDVMQRVAFHNTGPDQIPGLIAMSISDGGDLENLDPDYAQIVVLFNTAPETVSFSSEDVTGQDFMLHPLQQVSADPVVQNASFDAEDGSFSVPGRTTAVFVLAE
jgi:hypothetical protein